MRPARACAILEGMRASTEAASKIAEQLRAAPPEARPALLLLFGSRARGDAAVNADWDFGYLPGDATDPDRLRDVLVSRLRTEAVDLADLSRASGLLRYRAARDGVAIYEARPEIYLAFQEEAARAWCDMERVLRRAYSSLLEELGR